MGTYFYGCSECVSAQVVVSLIILCTEYKKDVKEGRGKIAIKQLAFSNQNLL